MGKVVNRETDGNRRAVTSSHLSKLGKLTRCTLTPRVHHATVARMPQCTHRSPYRRVLARRNEHQADHGAEYLHVLIR
ncbi:hypothetical protein PAXRUDRAFT_458656 [Paxillus rubicundulus Ve08.2h10]|uniref:Uncharacterized protein n=1 Tax=Paxillus rubicundulus Ve08.2h10 TaxID=930991 RepID=A0A0D0DWK5_9AGAM|nr:hypothetical protein PAXRUDRAFT_458656 [Paxillus rubicundulus Ve08.2h10]